MSTVEFPAPKGFVPPEGSEDEFDMVCSFKVKNGKLKLTKLGDHPMSESEKGEKESKPDYSEMANAIADSAKERSM